MSNLDVEQTDIHQSGPAQVSVQELRDNLQAVLDRVAAGETLAIVRDGDEVARLLPPHPAGSGFPDLTEFRASLHVEGEAVSETVIQQRREARY